MPDEMQETQAQQVDDATQPPGNLLPDHSLKRRYLYKVGTSLASLASNILMQTVVLRALGPALFGNFSYLTGFFTSVTTLLDGGTALGFYHKLTQRLHEHRLTRFYWEFTLFISILCLIGVSLALLLGMGEWLWPQIDAVYIWLGVLLAILTLAGRVAGYIMDAYGLTVLAELARMVQNLLNVGIVLLLFLTGCLTLGIYFVYMCLIMCALLLAWLIIMRRHDIALFPREQLTGIQRKAYFGEFFRYASPLFVCTAVAMLIDLIGRWMLQTFAGPVEQGYFGLARNLSIACFMFTSAMTPLIMRDFSQAFAREDHAHMRRTFEKYVPMMYLLSTYFGIFTLVKASDIVIIFGGEKFSDASLSVAIMALYPLQQTYGQMNGSLMLATNRTRIYATVSILFSILSLPAMIYFVGLQQWHCLEMGASGLAITLVFFQFLGVQIELFINTRFLSISYLKLLTHQFAAIISFGSIAFASSWAIGLLALPTIFALLASGLLYTILILTLCYMVPYFTPIKFHIKPA